MLHVPWEVALLYLQLLFSDLLYSTLHLLCRTRLHWSTPWATLIIPLVSTSTHYPYTPSHIAHDSSSHSKMTLQTSFKIWNCIHAYWARLTVFLCFFLYSFCVAEFFPVALCFAVGLSLKMMAVNHFQAAFAVKYKSSMKAFPPTSFEGWYYQDRGPVAARSQSLLKGWDGKWWRASAFFFESGSKFRG